MEENKKFKILAIDGGGIKGVYPAKLLSLIESELESDGKGKIHEHFDLITGTSTGGIIALSLALGIPAQDIYQLYINNANVIFGKKKCFLRQIFNSAHERNALEKLVRDKFREINGGDDPRIGDCKTDVAIPVYDLIKGNPSVLKTKYHENFVRDYHIPAYQAAMATSAAPTYFSPYSTSYTTSKGEKIPFNNKVDGGVMANNPTMIGYIEAIKAFKVKPENIEILSIGTGNRNFTEGSNQKRFGLYYWMKKGSRKRLIELFMQSQSQLVHNYMNLLVNGIDKSEMDNPNFVYDRIEKDLTNDNYMEMDETNPDRLFNYAELATAEYHENRSYIIKRHFYRE
jgi:uncharacterized protein